MPNKRRLHSDRAKDPFMDALIAPYDGYDDLPGPSTYRSRRSTGLTQIPIANDTISSPPSPHSTLQAEQRIQHETAPSTNPILFQTLYRAFGEWSWMNDLTIQNPRLLSVLDSRESYELGIKTGTAGGKTITYISKTCTTHRPWPGFLSEVVLYKQQLRHLQGSVVPTLIQISKDAIGRVGLVMAPPHPCFWIQASPDMPEILKARCVAAVQQLHDAGVLHGELLPSNVWLDAKGKVTIINFHKSRALVPCLGLGLFATTTGQLDLEMRKFKWQIDYQTVRDEEHARFMGYLSRTMRNHQEQEKAFLMPGYRPIIEETPQAEMATPPMNPTACLLHWLPHNRKVTRFILPDQTPGQFTSNLRSFLQELEAMQLAQKAPGDVLIHQSSSEEPIGNRLSTLSGSILSSLGKVWASSGLDMLCRKRGRHEPSDTEGRAKKRIRFANVPENEDDGESSTFPANGSWDDWDSPFSSADNPDDTRLNIVKENIAQCARLGLPHHEAVERDPGNPQWLVPSVAEFIKREKRDKLQFEQATALLQGTGHPAPPQRFVRSAGRIRRSLHAISHPSSLLEPTTPGPSRKRRRREDELDPFLTESRPQTKRQRCGDFLDSFTVTPQYRASPRRIPKRNPRYPTTMNNIRRRSRPGYQLRLHVKREGRMEREPSVPLSSVRMGESGPTASSSGPRPPFIEKYVAPSRSPPVSADDLACVSSVNSCEGAYLPSFVVSRWLRTLCRVVLDP